MLNSNLSKSATRKQNTFTVRLDNEQSAILKELAEHVEASTGIKVTHSWILRELLSIGSDAIKSRYKIQVAI